MTGSFPIHNLVTFILISVGALAKPSTKEFFLKPEAFNSDNVVSTSGKLRDLMHTSCQNDGIFITFSQKEMMELGILPNQLSLEDSQCVFVSNKTHYVGQVVYRSHTCGSRHTRDSVNSLHTIDNSVRFLPPKTSYEKGGFYDDEDGEETEGSGDGSGADNQLNLIMIQFSCQYKYAVLPHTSTTGAPSFIYSTTPELYPELTTNVDDNAGGLRSSSSKCPVLVRQHPCNCQEKENLYSKPSKGVNIIAAAVMTVVAFVLGMTTMFLICRMKNFINLADKKPPPTLYESQSTSKDEEYTVNSKLMAQVHLSDPIPRILQQY